MKTHTGRFLDAAQWTRTLASALALLAAAAWTAHAQTNLMVTGATHVEDSGQVTGYILFQTETPEGLDDATSALLAAPEFAVYRKAGLPDGAGDYELTGVIRPVADEPTVAALLQRSWALRPDLPATFQEDSLGEKLDNMFGGLSSSVAGQSTAAKLVNAIAAALADPALLTDLELLGKTFPGVNLCLGRAWAGEVSAAGPTTFEIRLRDSSGAEIGVTARVTIDGSQTPVLLPAPGNPVDSGMEISDAALPGEAFSDFRSESSTNNTRAEDGFEALKEQAAGRKVNRAARLRWATPVPLRQRSILLNGYNLWRLPAASVNEAWLAAGPTLTQLQTAGAVKVNGLPILNPEDLDGATAVSAGPEMSFFTDELEEGTPLPGGAAQFVYFTTAVDVLGRDGSVSPGGAVWILDRMPPPVVEGVEVVNNYEWSGGAGGSGAQRFALSWNRVEGDDESGTILYEVYRWREYDGAQRSLGALPVTTINGTLLLDDGLAGSPTEDNARETFWYTVRAVRVANAGGVESRYPAAHSAPVFGVIRDRNGPEVVGGNVAESCLKPLVFGGDGTVETIDDQKNERIVPIEISCEKMPAALDVLEWAEFLATGSNGTEVIARVYFDQNGRAERSLELTVGELFSETNTIRSIACRVGAVNGAVSDPVACTLPQTLPKNTKRIVIPFEAGAVLDVGPCELGGGDFPWNPGTGEGVNGTGTVQGERGTREFKIYRRVGNGPLTFVDRREVSEGDSLVDPVWSAWTDTNPPPLHGGRVCYFGQAFSVDGMAGPMQRIGCSVRSAASLPAPLLKRIETVSPNPSLPTKLRISWVCAPTGVDHFDLYISRNGLVPPANFGVDRLQANRVANGVEVAGQGEKRFGVYRTSRVDGRFRAPDAENSPSAFQIDLPADKGATYTVLVRARGEPVENDHEGAGTLSGPFSEGRDGRWAQTVTTSVNVPWPAREIPPKLEPQSLWIVPGLLNRAISVPAATGLAPVLLSRPGFNGVGVRIGSFTSPGTPQQELKGQITINNLRFDPNRHLYRLGRQFSSANALLPCALYRYRVQDGEDPGLSADLVQASPLMESIAYGFVDGSGTPDNAAGTGTAIHDPFIQIQPVDGGGNSPTVELVIADTLPVIRGQTYRYLLVRFDPVSKEPRDVIPVANSITIP
jgi:hypothetical protein